MNSRLLFTLIYLPLIIVVGELIHRQGRTVLRHAFGDTSAVATAVSMLLRFGWYLTSLGLLLWNLGVQDSEWDVTHSDQFTRVCFRLGVAIFVLGVLHGGNLLAVSLFHRKNV